MTTEPITVYSYTRDEAINDGVLVDVTPIARSLGIRLPVAVTCGLMSYLGVSSAEDGGATWSPVVAALNAARAALPNQIRLDERVPFAADGQYGPIDAVVVVHRGDELELVATLMLAAED